MDKDRIEGAMKRIRGNVKKHWGRLLGDTKTEAEGAAEEAEGVVQNTIGGLREELKKKDGETPG